MGLTPVKTRIREIAALRPVERARRALGLQAEPPCLHMSFTGNPGTGKTTVGLRIAEMLHQLGYIRRNSVVSVTRDDLVGQYIGHTAPKAKEVLKKAMGRARYRPARIGVDQGAVLFPVGGRRCGDRAGGALGNNLIIAVGGSDGLVNKKAFDEHKVIYVNLGTPLRGFPQWKSYGVCSGKADQDINPKFLSFSIYSVDYPCKITVADTSERDYQLNIRNEPPDPLIGCGASVSPAWRQDVHVKKETRTSGTSRRRRRPPAGRWWVQ